MNSKYQALKLKKEADRVEWLQNKSSSALRNVSGSSYEIINMKYLDSPAGDKKRYDDDMGKLECIYILGLVTDLFEASYMHVYM